jgi:hypothetical protein
MFMIGLAQVNLAVYSRLCFSTAPRGAERSTRNDCPMHIWVDADACPKPVKEILFRAAERRQLPLTLVANQPVTTPPSRWIGSVRVGAGFDVADNHIAEQAAPGDLVITADIPLAAAVVAKGCTALNPRGERYTAENVRERLNLRDFMDTLRGSGIDTGGPPAFGQRDKQAFANALDRLLARVR